jgi:CRISPR/Cas system-associated exonuclease Cas4 (RecB family)
MKILGKKRAVLIYENKNNHELLVIPVEVNDYYRQWVDGAFQWMRDVRKAWEDKTLPTKNYRSNSKICKTCPLSKVCADAGTGSIKIKSLEALSEVV